MVNIGLGVALLTDQDRLDKLVIRTQPFQFSQKTETHPEILRLTDILIGSTEYGGVRR